MSRSKHLLEIHVAVFLFGMAGLFGKWVTLPAIIIVLGRVFFASVSLYLLLRLTGRRLALNDRRAYGLIGLLGVILSVHWVAFFQSIQISSVAIGLLTFSTFPIFTVFLEPLFFQEKLTLRDIFLALVTFAGVALVVPDLALANSVTQGVLWGVASGATFALLSVLNRKYVQTYSSLILAFYQDFVATLILAPFLLILQPAFSLYDMGLLILLGVVFTALSHSMFISGLKGVPARTASIIAALEPVYGIIAAIFFLQEFPEWRVIAGGMIILGATAYATLVPRK